MSEITSLQQWFMHCGENVENVREYENLSDKFYNKLWKYDKQKSAKLDRLYYKPLMCNFYNKELKTFNKYIPLLALKGFLISLIFGLIMFIVRLVPKTMDFINNFDLYVKKMDSYIQKYNVDSKFALYRHMIKSEGILTSAIVLTILTIVLITTLYVFLNYWSIKSIANNLNKRENKLKPILEVIIPKFRSSERMDTLAKIYYKESTVTMTQAMDICDDFMREHSNCVFSAIMFDLPFANLNLANVPTNQTDYINKTQYDNQSDNQAEENQAINNPALPPDIATHTFNGSEDAQKDLNSMIGLEEVKQQVEKIKNRINFYGSANVGGGGNHMVFFGSAGSGKTSIARIITRIMYDLGYVKENKCVEISGDYLKSPYTGQTGERTSAIVEWAMGGVLFIDEAYLLYGNSDSASQEATGVLLKAMEDRRKDFIVILAGYEEQMTKLLASNEGFASRIKYKIYFPDYSVEEMYQIFTTFINKFNNKVYMVEDDAKNLLLKTFELEKRSRFFGNARTVRNAVDSIMDNYADRCIRENDKSAIIKLADVELYAKSRENELSHEIRNSSATNQIDESIIRLSELKQKTFNGSDNPDEDLNNMVGLSDFKNEIIELQNQKNFYGDDFTMNQQNILFIGEKGCGKSSLVKIFTGYLYQMGYIRNNTYLDISAEFMKGSYVGHTSRRAESIISYASGGVLYIRNIELLNQENSDSFSAEAMTAIITALSSKNDVTIIISTNNFGASYIQNIKNLFNFVYEFPNYTSSDLVQIFNINAQKDGFNIEQDVFNDLYNYLNSRPNVNIRDILNIYDATKKNHINNYTEENKYTIVKSDLKLNVVKTKLKINLHK